MQFRRFNAHRAFVGDVLGQLAAIESHWREIRTQRLYRTRSCTESSYPRQPCYLVGVTPCDPAGASCGQTVCDWLGGCNVPRPRARAVQRKRCAPRRGSLAFGDHRTDVGTLAYNRPHRPLSKRKNVPASSAMRDKFKHDRNPRLGPRKSHLAIGPTPKIGHRKILEEWISLDNYFSGSSAGCVGAGHNGGRIGIFKC